MRYKGFLKSTRFFSTLLTVVVLSLIIHLMLGTSDETSDCLLDLIGEQGICVHAPLNQVRCNMTKDADEPGLYICSDFPGPEGLMRIRLFSLDHELIHAIEVTMDPSRFSMNSLVREIKEDHPDYNLLFEQDSVVLFLSDTGVANGRTYLVMKRDTSSDRAREELLLVLMTEQARIFFENAQPPE